MIDATDAEALPLKADLQRFGQRQPACRALVDAHYGIGGLIAVAVWSELGDCRRFSRSEQVVRHTGLDVTVDSSDRRRAGGYLSRQGPQTLRWALYEAAKNALAPAQPRPRLLRGGEGAPRRQAGRHLGGPQARPPLLPHAAQPSTPTSSTPSRPDTSAGDDGRDRPPQHHGSPAVSSCHRRARQHPCWTAF